MSSQSLNLRDSTQPGIEKSPVVHLKVTVGDEVRSVRGVVGEAVEAAPGVLIEVVKVDRRLTAPVSPNGKCHYRLRSACREQVEYVRSEDDARRLFGVKFPGEEILEISVDSV